jgi:two-component system NtrC family sensor kinase
MRKLITFLLLLLTLHLVQAQNTETDSLKKLLTTLSEGPERVQVLEGLSYAYLSAYPDTAMQYAIQGLQLAQKINDRIGESYCINALGNVYFGVGDYPKALEMYLQSLKIKEGLKNQQQALSVTYFNIANVYTEQEDYSHALYYLFKSAGIDKQANDSASILFDLHSLSSIYLRMRKTDSALYYVQQAVELAGRLHDKNMIGAILNNYGEIHSYLKNYALAAKYYHQSIHYVKAINDNEVLSSNYYGLAKIYREQKLLDSSIAYTRKAVAVAQEAPFLKRLMESSSFLADLFKTTKQFDSAFHYQQVSIAAKDSLYNVEKIKKVQNLKLLEQQRQQAIEVDKIEFRNKVKLYAVIFASCVFMLIALLLWRNNKQKQKAYLLLQQQKLKTEEALNELQSTQNQLVQKEKMASLGELTAGIAHEIQNPLNFINNFSELNVELINELKEERHKETGNKNAEDEIYNDIKANLEKIIHHGKRADSIVKNMLEHSRASASQWQPTDINALADEFFKLSYHAVRAKDKSFNADMETHFDATIETINLLPQDIGRVLLNLFNNAFYAVNEKRKQSNADYKPVVSVTTKKLNTHKGEGGVVIIIRDNGIGIPQHTLHKIFQPFFTTKPTGQGTGLGLSLSYDIITKAHGGELKVNTKEGEYTEFIIELPFKNDVVEAI